MSLFSDIHQMRVNSDAALLVLRELKADFEKLLDCLCPKPEPEIVGIAVEPGQPTTHPKQETAKMATVKLVKKSSVKGTPKKLSAMQAAAQKGFGGPKMDFAIQDNQDDTCTVLGVDAAGNTVDISAVATLDPPPSSDNTSVLSVDAPSGMTFAMHAVGPTGSASVTATATWTDGSIGPFSFTLPVAVVAGPVSGVVIQPGTPTVR